MYRFSNYICRDYVKSSKTVGNKNYNKDDLIYREKILESDNFAVFCFCLVCTTYSES